MSTALPHVYYMLPMSTNLAHVYYMMVHVKHTSLCVQHMIHVNYSCLPHLGMVLTAMWDMSTKPACVQTT